MADPLVDAPAGPTSLELASGLRARVAAFDRQADTALDPLRGHPVADRVLYAASELADFSLLWHLIGAAEGLRSAPAARRSVRFAIALGAESLLVNQGVKRLFERGRPRHDGHRPHHLRRPSTSSFPSGHASAAFFAATILSAGRPRTAPALFGLAGLVGTSRAYVRIHHASDVVGGAAVGLVLGALARRWVTNGPP
ncbi:MAG: phosphatase PAP2 family protein [Acidimicrobiales bacterium]|nr:phosphatase PAP2 family protein [Acidimicrobiales bacterium]